MSATVAAPPGNAAGRGPARNALAHAARGVASRVAAARARMAAWRDLRALRWQPLTGLGAMIAALGVLAVVGPGRGAGDLVLLTAGVAAVAVVALSALLVLVRALVLLRDLRTATATAGDERISGECERRVRTGFRLPRRAALGAADVRWSWRVPEAGVETREEGRWLLEEVTATRRTLGHTIRRAFDVVDLFGLARVTVLHDEVRSVRFVPSRGNLRDVDLVRGLAGGDAMGHPDGSPDGDPIDLRPYAPGDPVRIILWKVYARNRELVVRTPERALSPTDRTVAYVVSGNADEPAAGAARVAVEGGTLGRDWLLGADGGGRPTKLSSEALDLLARSAAADLAESGAGLSGFLNEAGRSGASRAVVFVPATPGPWLERVAQAAAVGRADVDFLVCVDGVDFDEGGTRTAWWRAPAAEARLAADDLRETLRTLASTRRRVTVVDRRNGRIVDATSLLRERS